MSFLDRLDRKFGRFGVPNVTAGFIALQVITYVITYPKPEIKHALLLIPVLVSQGEVWRLFTFLAVPPITNPIFAFFFWYLFYIMGTALESQWGTFRYNVYLLIGYLATVIVSFLTPFAPSSNAFLQGSVYLAFAFLYPDYQLYLFFILPVKIKWLALITWIYYFYVLVFGLWPEKLLVLSSICNFLIFFAGDIRQKISTGKRHMEFQAKQAASAHQESEPFHRCVVCGITDITNPDMDFRYCPECKESSGYCTEHIRNHQHI
jgi:hypothetical protein